MNKQILGKQVTPGQSFSMPALTEVQISVLNTGLNLYKGDVDAFCQAICQLYAQNKRNYLTKDQTDKDMVKVFDMDKLRKRYNRIGTGDRNVKAILTKFNLEEDSGYRELMSITRAFTDGMRELKRNYPNCYEFLEYVDQFGALSSCRADTLKMHSPPVLLAGSPGVGKTAIVQEVAKLLGVGCKQLDMATVTSSFVITGSSSVWSDAKTGCIVDILRDGNAANPIVILDELDKFSRDAKFDPLGGLYTLLEQEAAATFTDEALEMPIDASHILYVATANDLSVIPRNRCYLGFWSLTSRMLKARITAR